MGVADRRPRHRLRFAVGVLLTVGGLVCLVLSAFVHSLIINDLTCGIVPGSVLIVQGWRGSLR